MPLIAAALITGVAVFVILALQGNGFRGLEAFIGACALVIAMCYLVETVLAGPDWGQVAFHSVIPSLPGPNAVLLAVGIIGATVMPHVIYVHSNLTQGRVVPATEEEARRVFSFERIDVIAAMGLAGLVNMAMLFMAAKVFHETGHADVVTIHSAYETLTPLFGGAAALVFGISLITSGVASSHVGTIAGQVVMQGFVNFRIPVWLRRLLTMLPALAAIYFGLDPTRTLVISQVVLSFTLPFPVITLIVFTADRELMGTLVNRSTTTALAIACAALILFMNAVLLYQTFGGSLPFA
jgi:manganese transport protein